jgi:hypothetical protein
MARGTVKARERILTDDELRAIWSVPIDGAGSKHPTSGED